MLHQMKLLSKSVFILLLYVLCIFNSELHAQVTIGSALNPKSGALLDLKENNNLGANANKGLMLPRVYLKDSDKLSPMFEDASNYNTSSSEKVKQDALHTGLVVYNINACFGLHTPAKGVYLWNGSNWMPVQKARLAQASTKVNTNKDQDGNTFYSGVFGAAGEWMLSNLRVKSDLGDASLGNDNTARWNYPNLDENSFNLQPSRGYLYNWFAAANKTATSGLDEGFGTANQLEVGGAGICPVGWHLPSDIEWTTFEKYIITNPSLYSQLPATLLPNFNNGDTGYRGKHAKALIASCLPYEFGDVSTGKSFPDYEHGFAAYLVGTKETSGIEGFGENTAFWTASSKDTSSAWARKFGRNNDGVYRGTSALTDMLSVRCKKTEKFERCGDPLTDGENNVYQTAQFGSAGCWMTTNLRSTQRGSISLSEGNNGANSNDQMLYSKPNTTDNDPQKGYLYTWESALAGEAAIESLFGGELSSYGSSMQGMCPDGWVVPSDADWNALEKEIQTNSIKYSTTPSSNTWSANYEKQIGWRPGNETGWGISFKTTDANGTSKNVGGMQVMMVGALESASGQQYGSSAYYWTSNDLFTAIGGDAKARYRALDKNKKDMYRGNASKSSMLSVRCKKYEP